MVLLPIQTTFWLQIFRHLFTQTFHPLYFFILIKAFVLNVQVNSRLTVLYSMLTVRIVVPTLFSNFP